MPTANKGKHVQDKKSNEVETKLSSNVKNSTNKDSNQKLPQKRPISSISPTSAEKHSKKINMSTEKAADITTDENKNSVSKSEKPEANTPSDTHIPTVLQEIIKEVREMKESMHRDYSEQWQIQDFLLGAHQPSTWVLFDKNVCKNKISSISPTSAEKHSKKINMSTEKAADITTDENKNSASKSEIPEVNTPSDTHIPTVLQEIIKEVREMKESMHRDYSEQWQIQDFLLGGRQPSTWVLFGKNVCKNKRIGFCWGVHASSTP